MISFAYNNLTEKLCYYRKKLHAIAFDRREMPILIPL